MCDWARSFDEAAWPGKYNGATWGFPYYWTWSYTCQDYIRKWELLHCPSDSYSEQYGDKIPSYDMNHVTFPKAPLGYGEEEPEWADGAYSKGSREAGSRRYAQLKASEFRDMSKIILVFDINKNCWPGGDSSGRTAMEGPDTIGTNGYDRHRMIINGVCSDGHAEGNKKMTWWEGFTGNQISMKRFWYLWNQ